MQIQAAATVGHTNGFVGASTEARTPDALDRIATKDNR